MARPPTPWRVLTTRGRVLLLGGLLMTAAALILGQRDLLRVGCLLIAVPVIAGLVVRRANLQISCERHLEPASQVERGTALLARLKLVQRGRLPAAMVLLADPVPAKLLPKAAPDPTAADRGPASRPADLLSENPSAPQFVIDRPSSSWTRETSYRVAGVARGHYLIGPLRVRLADPFGLAQLDRSFQNTSELLITPVVEPLVPLTAATGGSDTSEVKGSQIGTTGQDDAILREYRPGDDRRRIHWGSSARRGELVVRREVATWERRVSILLDARSAAHRGSGPDSSLEWAISAAASAAMHFAGAGFQVEIFEPNGNLIDTGSNPTAATVSATLALARLAELPTRATIGLATAVSAVAGTRTSQLVVAILGRLEPADIAALLDLRRHRPVGVALALDVDSFGPQSVHLAESAVNPPETDRGWHNQTVDLLTDGRWRIAGVTQGTSVAEAWSRL